MSKPLWKILLIVVGALAVWRGAGATCSLWDYLRLGPEVSAQVSSWELLPKGSKYALEAAFTYSYRGRDFTTQTVFSKPYFLNRASAEEHIQNVSGMSWTAWVDPAHPEHASLERIFPLRELIYALCLVAIFLYFVYLRFHLELLSRSM